MPGSSFIDGPGAFASASVCARIEALLVEAVRNAKRNGERVPADVLEFADATSKAARLWRTSASTAMAPSSDVGTSERSDLKAPRMLGVVMGTAAVADLIGTSPRNVVALANRNTLHGEKVGRTWGFLAADVAEYIEARSA